MIFIFYSQNNIHSTPIQKTKTYYIMSLIPKTLLMYI